MTKQETLQKYHNGDINSFNVAKEFGKEDSDVLDSILDKFDEEMDAENADQAKIIEEYIGKINALASTTKVEEPKADAPKVKTNENGTYQGIFLVPMNMEQRIPLVLNKMAETDEELAKAIKAEKKTFKGCCRWLSNNMADLARAMHEKDITFDDDSVHLMARYYMVNEDCLDVQNAVAKATEKKPKAEPKAKAKDKTNKTKAEPKKEEKKSATKVVPLTPSMGSLFSDDDFK